jgi:hypothetical protein
MQITYSNNESAYLIDILEKGLDYLETKLADMKEAYREDVFQLNKRKLFARLFKWNRDRIISEYSRNSACYNKEYFERFYTGTQIILCEKLLFRIRFNPRVYSYLLSDKETRLIAYIVKRVYS